VVLLDEPFSNLDAPQRERMRRELKKIIRAAKVTAVLVTHDQAEALAIADVVAVMRAGRIVQTGAPDDVYRSPVDPWVAGFLGDAVMLGGTVSNGTVETTIGEIECDLAEGTAVNVMVRPEWIHPTPASPGLGVVTDTEFYGHDQRVEISLPDGPVIEALVPSLQAIRIGDTVSLEILDAVVYAV
jgi:iron(III) transport system ATP-binding protein